MDVIEDQQQLLANSSTQITDATVTEETPLTQAQPDGVEEIPAEIPEIEWTTELLSEVCRQGDMSRLRSFIEFSQQTSKCGEHAAKIADNLDKDSGLSPLHYAARYQQLNMCLALLSNINFVFGVNIQDENDRTPVHSAFLSSNHVNPTHSEKEFDIDSGFGDKIQEKDVWQEDYKNTILTSDHPLICLFAKANGNIHARDKYLLTPLHYAVAHNNLAGVKQLVALHADIESTDRQGIRPLHLACKEGYLSIVEYLIELDAKIDAIDADYWTPMHYACARGHLKVIQLINSKEKTSFQKFIQMKTNTQATCLHLAVQHANIQSVRYIISQLNDNVLKILINEQVEPFGTPLHIAAKFCDPPMVNLLYRHGADPLLLNSHNQSSLHIASASNRLPIVQELFHLTQSSLLEIKDDEGRTALSVTTNPDIINQLISFGANISSLDKNNMNALMIAVSTGRISIVEQFLFSINDQSLTIFDQVEKRNKYSVFLIAAQTGSIEMCSLLLSHSYIRWNTTDKQHMNVFHISARHNHHKLIEFLCEQIRRSDKFNTMKSRIYSIPLVTDSDIINIPQALSILRLHIDAQNEDGKTPMHLAAELGHSSSIQILLKYGADCLLPNYVGHIPLHDAIQNGHSHCTELLLTACVKNMVDFQTILSRRQSPLITACQNGFVEIVRLLLSEQIGLDYEMNDDKDANPLEIAIKYHQIETIHLLLEHPHTEYWLMSIRNSKNNLHRTPLRDMIEYIPECAKHAIDKLVLKTSEIDINGKTVEKMIYNYKFIDDYFMPDGKLYGTTSHQLYRNHPFIIALDSEHHSLLKHPLAIRLMKRKWEQYRPLFYFTRILTFLLLLILTFYILIVPAPIKKSNSLTTIEKLILPMRWIIVILAGLNLFKTILEIILYRGLRVPFAQIFSIISFLSAIIAFIPYENKAHQTVSWQWQLAACSTLLQWFNTALILRSVPFIGNCIVMFQSVLFNVGKLLIVMLPLHIAFTIATQMMFHNQLAFVNIMNSVHKLFAMLVGEFGYETLFFSKPRFAASALIFIPFIVIMTVVFMNLLLGLTVGDIKSCKESAAAAANAYFIRELIYIEATLPSLRWLKSNITEKDSIDIDPKDSMLTKGEDKNEEEEYNASLSDRQRMVELGKSLDILNMLCIQTKQVLEKEIGLEETLKELLSARQPQGSMGSSSDVLNTST